jgi:hypothetical protein
MGGRSLHPGSLESFHILEQEQGRDFKAIRRLDFSMVKQLTTREGRFFTVELWFISCATSPFIGPARKAHLGEVYSEHATRAPDIKGQSDGIPRRPCLVESSTSSIKILINN